MTDLLDEIEMQIPALRRYARALTGSADRADDLVQDCIERAIRKKTLFRPRQPARPWLFAILLNIYRNDLKRRRRTEHAGLDALTIEPSQPAPQPDRLALNEVARAMQKLPDEQREALLLVVLEQMSYADAARTLGIPTGTLMSRLSRARTTLKHLTLEPGEPKLRAVK